MTPTTEAAADRRALLEVLAAAVLFGTTGTARSLGAKHAPALGVGAARLLIGGAVLVVVAARTGRETVSAAPRATRWALPLAGALTAVYQLAFFAALDRTGVAVGTVVTIGSGPPLAGALAMLAGHGRPPRRWALATAVAVAGVVLLANPAGGSVAPSGVALALLSAIGYAGYTVIAKSLIAAGLKGSTVMAWAFGIGGLLLSPALVLSGPGWLGRPSGMLTAAYLGVVPTGLAYVLYARGLTRLAASTVTTIVLAEPFVAAMLGVVVLGEHLALGAWIGCALVVSGLLLLALER